jgi:hypothetical protein
MLCEFEKLCLQLVFIYSVISELCLTAYCRYVTLAEQHNGTDLVRKKGEKVFWMHPS